MAASAQRAHDVYSVLFQRLHLTISSYFFQGTTQPPTLKFAPHPNPPSPRYTRQSPLRTKKTRLKTGHVLHTRHREFVRRNRSRGCTFGRTVGFERWGLPIRDSPTLRWRRPRTRLS